MQFSRKTDYGLILLNVLKPTFRRGGYVSLRGVAEGEHLPFPFLEKLAAALKRAGIIVSRRGAAGGYRLIRDPASITLQEVIRVFEEPPMMRCLRSPHPEKYCPLVPHCPTRKGWQALNAKFDSLLARTTLAAL